MKKILVINGPNLNFLGIREKSIYGTENYSALLGMIQKHAADLGIAAECWQDFRVCRRGNEIKRQRS